VGAVSVAPGEAVSAGATLVEIVSVDALQVRVAIYAGDLRRIDEHAAAHVAPLGSESPVDACPIDGPPTADPADITIDRYYALDSTEIVFRPGERVMVEVPLSEPADSIVVPYSAIVRDPNGAAWVYECVGPSTYRRARVEVTRRSGDLAVLAAGVAAGTCVASIGAVELLGIELVPGH
jgi:multidrug efflux pump subunit AcrA (membrane-fusion protein)